MHVVNSALTLELYISAYDRYGATYHQTRSHRPHSLQASHHQVYPQERLLGHLWRVWEVAVGRALQMQGACLTRCLRTVRRCRSALPDRGTTKPEAVSFPRLAANSASLISAICTAPCSQAVLQAA